MFEDWSNTLPPDPMRAYRAKKDAARRTVQSKYSILGFISSGTYGRVYKAKARGDPEDGLLYAIKKFKPDKEGEVVTYTGISQSAIREIALNREINHENVVALREVMLEDKSIYMVFDYAEHDFLQVIHHHSQTLRCNIQMAVLKSLIFQLLNGVLYLHTCHILHRDLKPANILITANGVVKIADLGLARLTYEPLQPLFAGDKVVVTIWYRAPELLMGAKHYNKAVDIWAVGCVLAELASLRPIFKGEEAKLDNKKNVPFQKDQLLKIFEILGTPEVSEWPGLKNMPEYQNMKRLDRFKDRLFDWCQQKLKSRDGYDFLRKLFSYDPDKRLTAREALDQKWFQEEPRPTRNAFISMKGQQLPPQRRITQDDASTTALPNAAPQVTQPNSGKAASAASFASVGIGGFAAPSGNVGSAAYGGTAAYGGMGMSRLGVGSGNGGESTSNRTAGGSSKKKARLG
ncbi:kinase-like protein [Rickenella mellea]|uniref:Cyclin-dependent kinase 8 n=1 Tax=Rickenella mellea TaxID=50990 RepID=A0A4R5XFV6_9AGAM|nr:kinase-like protein [Rickenella mellea]